MNIKERLQKNIVTDIIEQKNLQIENFNISDIFNDSHEVKDLVVKLVQNNRNIILLSNKSFDKIIIANYIKQLLQDKNVSIINEIDSNFESSGDKISIIPNPNIHTVIKILEQIIYGQSFIFGLNLGSYDNIIDKLKVLIAINYNNLSSRDIITLLAAANPIVVYISKNSNGQLYISKTDEIKFNQTKYELELFNIFDSLNEMKTEKEAVSNVEIVQDNIIEEPSEEIVEDNNLPEEIQYITKEENSIPEEQVEENSIKTSYMVETTENNEQLEKNVEPEVQEIKEMQQEFDETSIETFEVTAEDVVEEILPVINYTETFDTETPVEEKRILNKYQLLREKAKRKKLEENSL